MRHVIIRRLRAWTFLLFMGIPLAVAQEPTLPVGSPLPMMERSFQNATHGTMSTLEDLTGRVGTVIVFYCNRCLWVDKYESRLLDLADRYAGSGVRFILVNSNSSEEFPLDSFANSRERAGERHYEIPYLIDPRAELAQALGAERTPQVYVFDSRHTLVYVGAVDDNPQGEDGVEHPYLDDALRSLVSGEEIAVPVTKPFGCSIRCPVSS